MKRYESSILNALLDQYERSKSFIGKNVQNQSFNKRITDLFPGYADEANFDLFSEVNSQVASLEKEGLIIVKRKKRGKIDTEIISSVTLVINKLDQCYHALSRQPKADKNAAIKKLLNEYCDRTPLLGAFCEEQFKRLAENKKVQYSDDLEKLEQILRVLAEIESVEEETFIRNFSIRVLGDSKAFEHIKTAVISLLCEYGDYPDKECVLQDLNIVNNPGYVYVKGNGIITISYTDMGGWQFTFIQHKSDQQIEFHEYIAPVIGALRKMGVDAAFNGRNDLTIDGRKFSGNAQYRLGESIVHHGSLLFDTDIEQMVASTTVDNYKIVSKSIKSVRDRVTNIAEHLPAPMDALAFKDAMVRSIMNGSTRTYTVTAEDDVRIRQLAEERFRDWQCIYGANPTFNIDRSGRFAGGKIQFKIDVRKGVIRAASVYGDFFSTLDAGTISAALIGCRYERSAVLEALREHGIDGAIYRISAEEMAGVIAD